MSNTTPINGFYLELRDFFTEIQHPDHCKSISELRKMTACQQQLDKDFLKDFMYENMTYLHKMSIYYKINLILMDC